MPTSAPVLEQLSRGEPSDMDWLQMADCLWLAQHRDLVFFSAGAGQAKIEPLADKAGPGEKDDDDKNHAGDVAPPDKPNVPGPKPPPSPGPEGPDVPVIPAHGPSAGSGEQPASGLRIQKLITFPGSREMARALRPLQRRVPAGPRNELHVEDTVDCTASCCGVFQPVFRAARQRWISVDLVVDDSASMEFWSDLPRDMEALLAGSGVFHDVRRWMLDTRGAAPRLVTPEGAGQNPEILGALQKDRVVVLLTDTIGPAWHGASLVALLESWARRRSVAFIHILPPEQWAHTALWRTEAVRLGSKSTVPANTSQTLRADFPLSFRPPIRRIPFPVLALDAEGLSLWADLLSARGCNAIRGIQFCPAEQTLPLPPAPTASESLSYSLGNPHDASAQLAEFLSHAPSPLVVELATLLAAAPLMPEVMRIIQEAFLPQARHWHLAAIVFGGLARRSRFAEGRNWYEWLPGVQQKLLALGSSHTHLEVWQIAGQWLMANEPLYRSFQALYPHPGGKLTGAFTNESQYFALFESTLFKTWQGEWRSHGEDLERRLPCGRAIVTFPIEGFDGRSSPKVRVIEGKICVGGKITIHRNGQEIGEALVEKLTGEEALDELLKAALSGAVAPPGPSEGQAGKEYSLLLEPDLRLTFYDELTCWLPDAKLPPKLPRLLLLCDDTQEHAAWRDSGLRELLSRHFTLDDTVYYRVTVNMSEYAAALLMVANPELETNESSRVALLRQRKRRVFPVALISRNAQEVPEVAEGLPVPILIPETVNPELESRVLAALGVLPQHIVAPFGLTLIQCPAGDFLMGSPEDEPGRWYNEGPQHRVTLTDPFWLGQTPVTYRQWRDVIEAGVMAGIKDAAGLVKTLSDFEEGREYLPMAATTWDSAQRWLCVLNALTVAERGNDCPLGDVEFALPTEAQWEYACRAGTKSALYTGAINILDDKAPEVNDIAWYSGNANGSIHKVGEKRPNDWGLYDMLGNVREWCQDALRKYTSEDQLNPYFNRGSGQFRGGSYDSSARACRCANRGGSGLGYLVRLSGFRVAAVPAGSRWDSGAKRIRAKDRKVPTPTPGMNQNTNLTQLAANVSIRLRLNPEEVRRIFRVAASDKSKGGFQGFMVKLQAQVNLETSEIELTQKDLRDIRRKGTTGSGGFQSRMRAIFGRHFGKKLEGIPYEE